MYFFLAVFFRVTTTTTTAAATTTTTTTLLTLRIEKDAQRTERKTDYSKFINNKKDT